MGHSQNICGVVIPLCPATIHHLPDSRSLIVPVLDTIDSIDLHIHTTISLHVQAAIFQSFPPGTQQPRQSATRTNSSPPDLLI